MEQGPTYLVKKTKLDHLKRKRKKNEQLSRNIHPSELNKYTQLNPNIIEGIRVNTVKYVHILIDH